MSFGVQLLSILQTSSMVVDSAHVMRCIFSFRSSSWIPDCWDPFFVRRILQSRDVLHKTRFSSDVCSGLKVSQQDIAWLRILAPET
ncbi:hypothetical protein ABFA07_007722 [Porites harrisoni]